MVESTNDITALEERIRGNVGRYFPELAGRSVHVRCTPFAVSSTYPLLIGEVRADEDPAPLASIIIKLAPVYDDNNEGLTEFNHMRRFCEKIDCSGHLRVPRALDFFDDINAVLSVRVEGRLLADLIVEGCRMFSREPGPQDAVRTAAEWLHAFHDINSAGANPAFPSDFGGVVSARLGRLAGGGFPASIAKVVEETVADLVSYGRSRPVPAAVQHGDFDASNVLVGDGTVTVTDMSYASTAVIYDDLSFFIAGLETMSPWPRAPLFDRQTALDLRVPFVAGYFFEEAREAYDEVALEGYLLKNLLRRFDKQRGSVSSRHPSLLAPFDVVKTRHLWPRRILAQCRRITAAIESQRA